MVNQHCNNCNNFKPVNGKFCIHKNSITVLLLYGNLYTVSLSASQSITCMHVYLSYCIIYLKTSEENAVLSNPFSTALITDLI